MEDGEYPQTMTLRGSTSLVFVLAVGLGGGLLAGCGGSTKTVSVSASAPPASSEGPSTSTAATSTSSSSAATSSATTVTGGPSTTRTESAPAFTHQTGSTAAGTAAAATAVLRAHGYAPNDVGQYHPEQTLRVLVGTRTPTGDGYGQQAFFFLGGRYIGTDTSEPSATLRVVGQSDTEVTLAYPLYRPHDALCCPSGGEAKVSFQLNNGRLTPLQAIPPASSLSGLSRH
jgi:hypothetical protein